MQEPVDRVLVVSKTHLDVGFTDLAAMVRRRYLEVYFPRAVAVGAELRARGGPQRLRWTTGSWILSEALAAADRAGRRQLDAAIEAGDLCWHALPFTLHTEYCDRSLLEHGLSLSAELDRRYGRRTRAAKVTDVPGHTRGLVPVLADAGVDLLHVGVNPASSAPSVPDRFRWRDGAAPGRGEASESDAPELNVMYQPGGYGAVQVVPGTGTAVAVDLTGDNLGPPSAQAVIDSFADLSRRFPGAVVEASTLDEVAALLASVADTLPVVDREIGDTWIHGVGSDPRKTAAFRELRRQRASWIEHGSVAQDHPAMRRASTRLLLVAEHTWGLDQKTHWPVETHWDASDLAVLRTDPATQRFEASWAEQRAYLHEYVDELRTGGLGELAERAAAVLASTATAPVGARPTGDLQLLDPSRPVQLGGFRVTIDPDDGAVVSLVAGDGRELASPGSPLGRWALQTFDDADFQRWFGTYNGGTQPRDEWWARWDNTKPGLETSGAVSRWWAPTLRSVRHGARDGRGVIEVELGFDLDPGAPVAVPGAARMTIADGATPGTVDFELAWSDLPAARWPVAWWWAFAPAVGRPEAWTMDKLGEAVSPFDVVDRGGRRLHAADRVSHPDGVALDLLDAPLVAPGRPALLEWDETPVDLAGGWHVCLYDNLWGTNFPMWSDGGARVRVTLRVGAPPGAGGDRV